MYSSKHGPKWLVRSSSRCSQAPLGTGLALWGWRVEGRAWGAAHLRGWLGLARGKTV